MNPTKGRAAAEGRPPPFVGEAAGGRPVMFQSDGTNFNIMILEELSDIGFLELYRIVSNIDLMFSPGNKKL